jgi:hypothetical protein
MLKEKLEFIPSLVPFGILNQNEVLLRGILKDCGSANRGTENVCALAEEAIVSGAA